MRCNEFDALIEELLQPHQANLTLDGDPAGVLHSDAGQHMRECERCNSYFRARSAVQSSLHALASASAQGPSRATDRAVMESYRRLQQGRGDAGQSQSRGRVLAFPGGRGITPAARTRWGSLAVAAALLAIVSSGIHLWTGTPTVTAPSIATAPAPSQSAASVAKETPESNVSESNASESNMLAAGIVSRQSSPRQLQARLNRAIRSVRQELAEPAPLATADAAATGLEDASAQGSPANSIMHLASTGGAAPANGVAQSAGSTWPGYNDLMYCDPVTCSGPMQVVNIKVPASQVKPGGGKAVGNSFVNVEVVVGPDGVARAIRAAN